MEKKVVRWKTAVTRLRRELAKDGYKLILSRTGDREDLVIDTNNGGITVGEILPDFRVKKTSFLKLLNIGL
jgi:hypothetical protein